MFVSDKFLLRKDQEVILMFQGSFTLHNQSDTVANIEYSDNNGIWHSFIELAPNTQIEKDIEHSYIRLVSDNEVYCLLNSQSTSSSKDTDTLQDKLVKALWDKMINKSDEKLIEIKSFVSNISSNIPNYLTSDYTYDDEGMPYPIFIIRNPFGESWDITEVITFKEGEQTLNQTNWNYSPNIPTRIELFYQDTLLGVHEYQPVSR